MEQIFEPYVGPRPFELADVEIFYGRDREARHLHSLIIANSVVLFYAPPGAGKTSLLNAKVIPLMKKDGMDVLPIARVTRSPSQNIDFDDEIRNIYVFNAIMGWRKKGDSSPALARETLAEFLTSAPRRVDEDGWPLPRLLIFDQFEELFESYPERWKERKEFFQQIAQALEEDRSLRVLFSVSENHIAKLDPYAHLLPANLSARYRMELLNAESALSAVQNPLRKTRLRFAPGVAEQLVRTLLALPVDTRRGTSEIEREFIDPTQLQIACARIWETKRNSRQRLIIEGDLFEPVKRDPARYVSSGPKVQRSSIGQREVATSRVRAVEDRIVPLLIGGGVGAVLALLFAPKSGQEVRGDIADATRRGIDRSREAARQLGDSASEYYEQTRERATELYAQAGERASGLYSQAAEKVGEVAQTARETAGRQTSTVAAAIAAGKKAYEEEKRETERSGHTEGAPKYTEKAN